ncbi:exopolysaccharide biosynthesis protein [Pelagibacterium montanilacus]|uniref:exopolysaccharide biosynthesis protein n=1 Tax=Pelagibacterium montanilacus TaxID=2185280 RepID=UPI000F8CD00E|nr:exopolysaccharide biosynthesis protein [Pelagibacterium montanilacus]
MADERQYHGALQKLVQRLKVVAEGDRATVGDLLDEARHVSFHALALAPALMVVTPLSAIPGLSAAGGIVIFLICGQHLFGRDRLWLPHTMTERQLDRSKLERSFKVASTIARRLDRLCRPRLAFLVRPPMRAILNAVCAILGICMPIMELIPTSSSLIASVVVLLQLALITEDGLLVAIGLTVLGLIPFALSSLITAVSG